MGPRGPPAPGASSGRGLSIGGILTAETAAEPARQLDPCGVALAAHRRSVRITAPSWLSTGPLSGSSPLCEASPDKKRYLEPAFDAPDFAEGAVKEDGKGTEAR